VIIGVITTIVKRNIPPVIRELLPLNRLRKNSLGAGRSAGFQPATPLLSSEAGKLPALQRAPQRFFRSR
jgi:hypothetical protein